MSGNATTQFTGSGGFHDLTGLSIFAPDTITPAQYFGSMGANGVDTPEKRLLLTILVDAVRCIRGISVSVDDHGLGRSPSRARRLRADALEWLAGKPALVTFDFICEVLGINPEWLRQGIHALPTGTKINRTRSPAAQDGIQKIGTNYVRRRRRGSHPKFGMAPRVKKTSAFSPLTGQQAFVMDGLAQEVSE